MTSYTNTSPTGAPIPITRSSTYVAGNVGGFYVWAPTCRQLQNKGKENQSARTATTCYMRGLPENIRIQSSSGIPWFWRRICFTLKGYNQFNTVQTADTPTINNYPYYDVSNSSGLARLWLNEIVNSVPATRTAQLGLLFRGLQGTDWDSVLTAPVDTTRVSVKYDKCRTLHSGNSNGFIRDVKLWHPMNHNIVYDDDESGGLEASSYYSVDSKLGMGDYYVVDYFEAGTLGGATDALLVGSTASLYWHEK